MNTKTIATIVAILIAFAGITVISYTGYGLPTQKQPLSIRQLSAQNQRDIMGGGTSYGK